MIHNNKTYILLALCVATLGISSCKSQQVNPKPGDSQQASSVTKSTGMVASATSDATKSNSSAQGESKTESETETETEANARTEAKIEIKTETKTETVAATKFKAGTEVEAYLVDLIEKKTPQWKVDPNDWKRMVVWLDANYDDIKGEEDVDLPTIDAFLESYRKKWNQENKEKKDSLLYRSGMDYQNLLKECPLLHEIEIDTNPDTYLEPYRRVQEEEAYIVMLINQQDPNRYATLDSWKQNVVWLDFHYDELKSKPDVDLVKVDSYREAYHSVWRCEGLPLDRKEGETSPSRPKNVQDIPEYQELFKALEDELNKK